MCPLKTTIRPRSSETAAANIIVVVVVDLSFVGGAAPMMMMMIAPAGCRLMARRMIRRLMMMLLLRLRLLRLRLRLLCACISRMLLMVVRTHHNPLTKATITIGTTVVVGGRSTRATRTLPHIREHARNIVVPFLVVVVLFVRRIVAAWRLVTGGIVALWRSPLTAPPAIDVFIIIVVFRFFVVPGSL